MEGGDETEEEMEGGEEETFLLLSSSHRRHEEESGGDAFRRRKTAATSPSVPCVRVVLGVWRRGSLLGWTRVDRGWPKTNPNVAKCVFRAAGRIRPRVGSIPPLAGFQPDSTPFPGYPNEA
jgi:hypothetical protein